MWREANEWPIEKNMWLIWGDVVTSASLLPRRHGENAGTPVALLRYMYMYPNIVMSNRGCNLPLLFRAGTIMDLYNQTNTKVEERSEKSLTPYKHQADTETYA